MCRLAAGSVPCLEVSELEVSRTEPSYTIYTLRQFADTLPRGTEVILLVGEDNLPTLHTWKDIREIVNLATVAILPRPGTHPAKLEELEVAIGPAKVSAILANRVPAPLVPISATEIRQRVADRQPIRGFVPASIARYIAEQQLYRHTKDPAMA